jgi:hypothetical protein
MSRTLCRCNDQCSGSIVLLRDETDKTMYTGTVLNKIKTIFLIGIKMMPIHNTVCRCVIGHQRFLFIPRTNVSDPNPDWIRILSGEWIRIRIRNPDKDPDCKLFSFLVTKTLGSDPEPFPDWYSA